MEVVVDCVEIASLTRLDLKDVQEIVRVHCHNDRDEANRAVAQFFDGMGPFIEEASGAWKSGGGKTKSRKSEEGEAAVKEERKLRLRGKGEVGEATKGGRGESRGSGKGDGEARGRGRGIGRGRLQPDDPEQPPRPPRADVLRGNSAATASPAENGSPAPRPRPLPVAPMPTPTPAEVPKPIVPSKPIGNAWAKPKDWVEEFIEPTRPAAVPPAKPDSPGEDAPGLPVRERGGRGRVSRGDRRVKGDTADDASRGRGRKGGSTSPGNGGETFTNGGVTSTLSDLTADLQSVMAQDSSLAGFAMRKSDSMDAGLPMMTSLATHGDHLLPMPHSGSPAGSMLLTDPAILGMSGTPSCTSSLSCSASLSCSGSLPGAAIDTAGVIMPTQHLGDSSKLQFGFGDSGSTAAPREQPTQHGPPATGGMPKLSFGLGGVDLSSSDLVDSICNSTTSTSLPMPASLANALPSAGGNSLPGFESSTGAPSAMSSDKMLSSGLKKLGLDTSMQQGSSDDSAALASLPSALAGLMKPHGLPQPSAFAPGHAQPVSSYAPVSAHQSTAFAPMPARAMNAGAAAVPGAVPPGVGRPMGMGGCALPGQAHNRSHASVMGGGVGMHSYAAMGQGMGLPPGSYAEPPGTAYSVSDQRMEGSHPSRAMESMMPQESMAFDPMGMPPHGMSGYDMPISVSPAAPHMAGRPMGPSAVDKDGPRRGRKKKGERGGAAPATSGERSERAGAAGGLPQPMHSGGDMGVPPGIGMGMGGGSNGSVPVSAAQAQPNMMQPSYGQQQQYGYGMVPPALMASPYGGYGAMPHGYGSGMYQVPGMQSNMYGAPSHNSYAQQQQYVPQQQPYVQQPQYLSQQSSSGPTGGYVQSYQSQQQMPMQAGGMSTGFNANFNSGSNSNFGGYEDSPTDYSQQAGMFSANASGGGYYRPSC